jgi:DNA mismatch repair ATPase MutS
MIKTFLLDKNGMDKYQSALPWNADSLIIDLGLNSVLNAMSSGDEFLLKNSTHFLLNSLDSTEKIRYRQEVMQDFMENRGNTVEIYNIAASFVSEAQKQFFWFSDNASLSMQISIEIIRLFAEKISKIREIIINMIDVAKSTGLKKFHDVVSSTFSTEYMDSILKNLERLQFKDGVTMSVSLGTGNEGKDYILHEPETDRKNIKRIMGDKMERHYTYTLPERDINGGEEIANIRNRGVKKTAMVLRRSAEHCMEFFKELRSEIGFYLASINLLEKLKSRSGEYCFPEPSEKETAMLKFSGLYNPGLMLTSDSNIVRNDLDGNGKNLFVITGTNRGGKSTFLKSIGQAQLMMQAGMFVASEYFSGSIVTGLFTHFKHEEDKTMERGKFDDELSTMDQIAGHIRKNGLILFNESFSSTNTREGADVAMGITDALLENNIRIFFVSHLFEFASAVMEQANGSSIFLIAERKDTGEHTYKIIEGKPSSTGYGMDLYRKIFG